MFDSESLHKTLLSLRDEKYRTFSLRLIPGVPEETVIGVRFPQLRTLARQLSSDAGIHEFLDALPHAYYEEDILHCYLLGYIKSAEECAARLDAFLPYVSCWAVCDAIKPAALSKTPGFFLEKIRFWLESDRTYTIRFALGMLMTYFLDERFSSEYLERVASLKSDEYYVNMMVAWYFATALAKQWEYALPYIAERRLSPWCHAKTIQKAGESFRVPPEHKEILRSLK